jgi:hypothetical protein
MIGEGGKITSKFQMMVITTFPDTQNLHISEKVNIYLYIF